ncbi:hypothetical protein [Putridiphycobacter roseus]|nr:hypothetical protein [Putridiphycobacter roseus]
MKNNYSNKAEICYKNTCAKFYNKNANIITAVVALAVFAVGMSAVSKTLK